ncbi:MAG: hypothetical protein PUP92_27070 [Rhizonema sp. PD38]|nr:hypothetical protein [Rhizonema sp. PD38]
MINSAIDLKKTHSLSLAISQLVPASNRLEVYDFDANYNWANSPQQSNFPLWQHHMC